MNQGHINRILRGIPKHLVIISLVLLWIIPTIGLLVTSFRPVQDIYTSGWWTVFSPRAVADEYTQFCSECHGADGKAIPEADLSDPAVASRFSRSLQILAMLRREATEGPHAGIPIPTAQEAANIADQIQQLAGGEVETAGARFTIDNYVDALVGYRGTGNYRQDCADGEDTTYSCTWQDYLNPRGMGRAFFNSLLVTIRLLSFRSVRRLRGYAFAWMGFSRRYAPFALLLACRCCRRPVPISRLYFQAEWHLPESPISYRLRYALRHLPDAQFSGHPAAFFV
jgi:alpha-glucoside transport system permease protein